MALMAQGYTDANHSSAGLPRVSLDSRRARLCSTSTASARMVSSALLCRPNSSRISVRDMPTILEGISEACGHTRNVMMITEHVRARLARQVSYMNANEQGFIPLITLSPQWEQAFAVSLVG